MEHEESRSQRSFGRRAFLKATGGLGMAAATTSGLPHVLTAHAAPMEAAEGEEVKYTICDMCAIGYCGMEVLVKDGVATRVQSMQGYPRGPLCSKGNAILHQVYHPDRLKYPMKRTNPKDSADPGWKRITWDEALDTMAAKFTEIKEKYGAEKVLFYAGDPKESPRPPLQRLALKFGSPNYGTESSTCSVATRIAVALNGTGSVGLTPATKAVIMWAHNPGWSMAREMGEMVDAKNRGVKLIDVDPRQVPVTKLADIHLQLRPGTDGALAHGLANVIISEELYDKAFVQDWTFGFEEYAKYVADFTPEVTEGITGVPADKIVAAARMYATNTPTGWITSASPTVHHWNGCQNHRAISAMTALTGAVAVPGLKASTPGVTVRNFSEWQKLLPPLQEKRADLEYFPVWAQFCEELQINMMPEYVESGALKAGLFCGGNFRMWPQDQLYLKAISDMEFTAGGDFWLTPTMQVMDIVLPIATSLERMGPVQVAGRTVFLRQPAIEPVGEARGDTEFLFQLGTRLGMGEDFWHGDLKAGINWQLEPLKLTVDDLAKEPKGTVIPPGEPTPPSDKPGFNTPTGKFEFYSKVLEEKGFDPLPTYKEPPEGPVADPEMAKKYPLVFNTGSREPMFVHSRHRNNPRLRELQPNPKLDINPVDAKARGIQQDDDVVVETPIGKLTVKANVTNIAAPDVIHMYHGWVEADVNTILPRTFDPISGFPAFKSQLCQVTKA